MKKLLLLACLLLTLSCSEDIPVSTSDTDTVEIYGIVSDSDGLPRANVMIAIRYALSNTYIGSSVTGNDGYYRIVFTPSYRESVYVLKFTYGDSSYSWREMSLNAKRGDKIELNMRI